MAGLAGCGSPETKAQNYYEQGMALIAKNDDLNARVELLNAVKYKADKVEVWRALAGIDERTKAQSLFTDLRRIVELDPNDLDARLKLARIMIAGGAVEAASKVLAIAKEGDTPNADFHALKSAILARTNDPTGALKEAQRAMEIDANNVEAVGYVAARKASERDPDGALKLLDALQVKAVNAYSKLALPERPMLCVEFHGRESAVSASKHSGSRSPTTSTAGGGVW